MALSVKGVFRENCVRCRATKNCWPASGRTCKWPGCAGEANEPLRESKERLHIALDTGKLGSWQLDFATLHMDCTAWLVADDERHTGFRVYCFDTLYKRWRSSHGDIECR